MKTKTYTSTHLKAFIKLYTSYTNFAFPVENLSFLITVIYISNKLRKRC